MKTCVALLGESSDGDLVAIGSNQDVTKDNSRGIEGLAVGIGAVDE